MKLDSDEIREAADTLLKSTLKEIFTNDSLKISISDFNTQSDRGIVRCTPFLDNFGAEIKVSYDKYL